MGEATFDSMKDKDTGQLRFAAHITHVRTNTHQSREIGLISTALMPSCAGIQVTRLVKALSLDDRGVQFQVILNRAVLR